jgi:hypothetical protein
MTHVWSNLVKTMLNEKSKSILFLCQSNDYEELCVYETKERKGFQDI